MSKLVKSILVEQARKEFSGLSTAFLVNMSALTAKQTSKLRSELGEQKLKVRVVKNRTAAVGLKGSAIEGLAPHLKGVNAIVYGGDGYVEAAKALLKKLPEYPKLELKGGVVEGDSELLPIERISKMKSRQELLAEALGLILSPGRRVVGQLVAPGRKVAGCIKAIEEKKEKGEAIAAA